jgi:hypothetical protein
VQHHYIRLAVEDDAAISGVIVGSVGMHHLPRRLTLEEVAGRLREIGQSGVQVAQTIEDLVKHGTVRARSERPFSEEEFARIWTA